MAEQYEEDGQRPQAVQFGDRLAAALVVRDAGFPSAVTSSWALDLLDRARPLDPAGLDTLAGPGALSVGAPGGTPTVSTHKQAVVAREYSSAGGVWPQLHPP